jgi:hypothetical protein
MDVDVGDGKWVPLRPLPQLGWHCELYAAKELEPGLLDLGVSTRMTFSPAPLDTVAKGKNLTPGESIEGTLF